MDIDLNKFYINIFIQNIHCCIWPSIVILVIFVLQDGQLEGFLKFDDGTILALESVHNSDYVLKAEALDSRTVSIGPSHPSSNPTVIALSSAKGDLIKVNFLHFSVVVWAWVWKLVT